MTTEELERDLEMLAEPREADERLRLTIRARLGEQINLARPLVQARLEHLTSMLGTVLPGDPPHAAIRMLGNLVIREATVLTFNDALFGMAAAFLLTLAFMPLVRKPAHPTTAGH